VSEFKQSTGKNESLPRRFSEMIGESKSILQVFKMIEKVCDTNTTVLIHGESGTGKELIARALHFNSERREGPFIPVNCGAIPSELLESELFGHEKGAFTHAVRTRMGRFELADGGTVFLDEVAEMSPMLQVKLLRVLQERQFERIGGTKTITSDFRVVAATNRDLEEDVKQGKFREDLYYRLLVIPIYAPPLRQRFSDIPLLVEKFLHKFNKTKKRNVKGITEEVMERLFQYSWPGNVRELENLIERMVILAVDDVIGIDDLPERFLQKGHGAEEVFEIPDKGFSLSDVVGDYEKRLIIQALNQTNWIKSKPLLNIYSFGDESNWGT
jgi:transcriptional regulator with GAF, ATPase, and Fis domain